MIIAVRVSMDLAELGAVIGVSLFLGCVFTLTIVTLLDRWWPR